MKMKKVAALSLAVAMVVGMMACGNSGGSNSTTAQENLVTAADGGDGSCGWRCFLYDQYRSFWFRDYCGPDGVSGYEGIS